MAGLEVLFTCVGGSIACPQDAVVCLAHWEMIKAGYRCLGSGDEARGGERPSELLPADWSSNKELYSLRYTHTHTHSALLLKAITVDHTLIFNLMDSSTQQVSDLTVNISDHVDVDHLGSFDRVFKDADSLSEKVRSQLLPPPVRPAPPDRKSPREDRNPPPPPSRGPHPHRSGPSVPPFAVGGADLDPFGSRGGGGMIFDPLRSGFPRSGVPDVLPPGALPPGARYDPIGPLGLHRAEPDPDHMPPPGYDDMFM